MQGSYAAEPIAPMTGTALLPLGLLCRYDAIALLVYPLQNQLGTRSPMACLLYATSRCVQGQWWVGLD